MVGGQRELFCCTEPNKVISGVPAAEKVSLPTKEKERSWIIGSMSYMENLASRDTGFKISGHFRESHCFSYTENKTKNIFWLKV